MSDEQHWKPPVPVQPPHVYGSPDAHPYGPPSQGSPPAPAGSWTAPPKPGLIPLRPLTLGTILTGSFQVLRRNPRPTFGFAFGIQSAIMLLTLLITGAVTFAALSRLFTASSDDATEITAGAVVMIMLSTLIPGVLSIVALALVQGVLMLEIQRATLGEKLKLKQLWRRARGRIGALIGWVLLLTVALLVALAVLAVLIVLLTMLDTVGIALAVVVGIFGGLGLLALGAWLGTKVSLVPSVLMGERTTLRESVSRSWRLTDGYFWRTFGIQSAIMLLTLLITGAVTFAAVSRLFTASTEDATEITAGAAVMIMLSTLVPGVLSVVALALVQGVLMLEIQRATLGEKLKLKQLWRRARGRIGALIGWVLLLTVALLVALAVLAVLIVLLTMLGTVGIALAVVVGIFGGLGLLALGAWLGTKVSLVPSVLMGERSTLREAISRSWRLTDGYFWRTFGIQLLVSVILSVAMQVITVPIQLVAPMAVFLIDPNGTGGPVAIVAVVAIYLVSLLIVLVMSSVVLVVQSAATGLIYIDLRMRKEGLDLDLARYVEEVGAGQNPPDPYRAP